MTTYVFEEVRRSAQKHVLCSVCGKKLTRSKTFINTINPWNVNEDGTERTRSEIYAILGAKIAVWQAEPESHTKCAA